MKPRNLMETMLIMDQWLMGLHLVKHQNAFKFFSHGLMEFLENLSPTHLEKIFSDCKYFLLNITYAGESFDSLTE